MPRPEEWLGFLECSYDSRWFSNGGPVAAALEEELAARVGGQRELVLVSSATSGLTATLLALGVQGRVAAPAFTFPATIHAIEAAGLTPVLCDVAPTTWELDVDSARRAVIEHGCTAIVHVRAFGLCHDLSAMEQLARELDVPLVVDAAAAFGGLEPSGRSVGHAGDAEVFSFHATKVFAVGEGGAVATTAQLAARIRHVANFAIDGSDVTGRGLNAKLGELQAAVGRAMLRRLDEHLVVRRTAAARLAATARAAGGVTPACDAGAPPWQCLPVLLPDGASSSVLLDGLARDGIEGRAYYCPGLHRSTAWRGFAPDPLPVTDAIAARLVCMPIYSDLAGTELAAFAATLGRAIADAAPDVRRHAA